MQAMRAITTTRDHRETFKAKHLQPAEKYVGKGHHACEVGIDDQYTIFYFSKDVAEEIIDWCLSSNKYMIWHLLESGMEFSSLDDLIGKINAAGKEWDEDSWEDLVK